MCPLTSGPKNYPHIEGIDVDDVESQSQNSNNKANSQTFSRSLPHSSSSSFIHPHRPAPHVIPPTLLPAQLGLHHTTDSLLSRNREFAQLLSEASHSQTPASAHSRKPSSALNNPQMRYMRLIGNSNPRYNWAKYIKAEEELRAIKNQKVYVSIKFDPIVYSNS